MNTRIAALAALLAVVATPAFAAGENLQQSAIDTAISSVAVPGAGQNFSFVSALSLGETLNVSAHTPASQAFNFADDVAFTASVPSIAEDAFQTGEVISR